MEGLVHIQGSFWKIPTFLVDFIVFKYSRFGGGKSAAHPPEKIHIMYCVFLQSLPVLVCWLKAFADSPVAKGLKAPAEGF